MAKWIKSISLDEVSIAIVAVVGIVAMLYFVPVEWKETVGMAVTGVVALARGRANGANG